jgi:hypothetical protein
VHSSGATLESVSSITANTSSEGSQNSTIIPTAVDEQDESTPLLGSPSPPMQQKSFAKAFMQRETPQGTALEVFTSIFDRNHTWNQIVFRLLTALVCISFFAAVTIMAIYSVWIATQLSVLSASDKCGLWTLDPSVNIMPQFYHKQEKEAGDYATRCYNAPPGADGCNFFVAQSINYTIKDQTACPFADGFCLEDENAYTLTTDLISSKELGINVPVGYTFNRTTTCSPIQRIGYYDIIFEDEEFLIEYNYGQLEGITEGNLTWISFPSYREWIGTGYQVE